MAVQEKLQYYPLTHGGIRKMIHPRLQVEIDNQTAVKYLRFIHPVRLNRLELPRSVYGRWIPSVPTHPAHLIISVPDLANGRWKAAHEASLPYDRRTAGEGLSQGMEMPAMEAHFAALLNDPPYPIDLDGVETDILRVECDREHPVWPNHGECNGSPYSVPFGILDPLIAYGSGVGGGAAIPPYRKRFVYQPGLQVTEYRPAAPQGMQTWQTPLGVYFASERLQVGFSLRRPLLLHLGWDAFGKGQAANNRLKADWAIGIGGMVGGLSGPLLRTFEQDCGAQHWTGQAAVRGNVVEYANLHVLDGLTITARFTVEADHLALELAQVCTRPLPVLEAETWRLAWDLRKGMTATAALPTLKPGRSGKVDLPLAWATDGAGCLMASASTSDWEAQVESYRYASVATCGFAPRRDPGNDGLLVIPPGEQRLTLQMWLDSFQPQSLSTAAQGEAKPTEVVDSHFDKPCFDGACFDKPCSDGACFDKPCFDKLSMPEEGLRRHWGSVFSCFRPEMRGFSNNTASVNCHLSQIGPLEIAFLTRQPAGGPDPLALGRFTIQRALLDGGGYGYWRNLYLDSDPALLIAAGRLHQARPDLAWLRAVAPGLREVVERMLAIQDEQGLLLCRDLSGNAGSFRWSCNSMDVVGFGHLDGYVNAIGYRALRNATALLQDLGDSSLAERCRTAAQGIRAAYGPTFLNPATGWLAGWRSRDGQLHDYAFLWVNGPALAYGLLDDLPARQALLNLEAERQRVGLSDATLGLPGNLRPIDPDDHLMPAIWGLPSPTFEGYTDGGLFGFNGLYYQRALARYGLREQAAKLARELERGLAAGCFNGGIGMGNEFRTWDGLPTGYEGTLIGNFGPVYSLAIELGVICPPEPEWWPAGG